MKNSILKCPKCNRNFWGEDLKDCESMIVAHLLHSCEKEMKMMEELLKGDKNA